jgi:uncharacterized protein YecT (DUF1311 family)
MRPRGCTHLVLAVAWLTLSVSLPAAAQTPRQTNPGLAERVLANQNIGRDPTDDCDGDPDTPLDCAVARFRAADVRLNEDYQALLQTPGWSAANREALRNVQRAWRQFRDANCTWQSGLYAGSAATLAAANCLAEITLHRAEWLEEAARP